MAGRLEGKIALLTGAGQGIGAAIGSLMKGEGAVLIATDLSAERARLGVSQADEVLGLDIRDRNAWREAADLIQQRYGRLDVLVNNAGVATSQAIEDCTPEDWRLHMSVNVDGPFIGLQVCLPLLKTASLRTTAGASVVNIASVASVIGVSNQAAYNSSKAAVRQLSRSLAIEFASKGLAIRVNVIHPGVVRTPLLLGALEKWKEAGNVAVATEEAAGKVCPMGRVGQPEDIAYGVLYLASDESGYVTGSELVIDGGWTAQ